MNNWQQIVTESAPMVLRVALRILGNHADAKHVAGAQLTPVSVGDGQRECKYKTVTSNTPDATNPDFATIVSLEKTVQEIMDKSSPKPTANPTPPEWRVSRAWHPGIGGKLNLVDQCNDGPRGTIGIDSAHGQSPFVTRQWLDPTKEYAAVRGEHLKGNDKTLVLEGAEEVVAWTQTPDGGWLPTLIRQVPGSIGIPADLKNNDELMERLERAEKITDGRLQREEYFYHFLYDFDVAIPDELFELNDECSGAT